MTIVLVTASDAETEITAYSDSRVSGAGLRLESAAKILILPVRSFMPDETISHSTSYGFAFSGSTLVAQTLFAFASTSLQSLRMEVGASAPSLDDIAQFLGKHLRRLSLELGENGMEPQRIMTEVFIFGFCPAQCARRLFRLETHLGEYPINVGICEHDVSARGSGYLLGDTTAFNGFERANNLSKHKTIENLRLAISSEEVPTIGGDIQVLRTSKHGAKAVPTLTIQENGKASIRMLNTSLDGEVVGGCHFKHRATRLT